MQGHRVGIALALFAVIAVSSDGVLVKLASKEGASVVSVIIFKSFTAALTMAFLQLTVEPLLSVMQGQKAVFFPPVSRLGLAHICTGGGFSMVVFVGFTLSFYFTTSANVLAFTALAPIWTSLLAKPVLGERVLWRTVWANVGALLGTVVVVIGVALFGGETSSAQGAINGIICAILTGLASAGYFVTNRSAHVRAPGTPMVYAGLLGMILATLLGLALTPVLHPSSASLAPPRAAILYLVLNGCCCVALALFALTLAFRFSPPSSVSLIMQLEGLLGPISTYLILNEIPSPFTLAGGSLVLLMVIGHEALIIFLPVGDGVAPNRQDPEGGEPEVPGLLKPVEMRKQ
ncbi:hypothetical protein T492DRAFT_1043356 [Pavlovales sp. CCMP2436]|nr:hypothetical protein T492DRAFT_1043356 [Pavlovales sp. CCMP2436]|mmetsp:Transcript_2977/g.7271  ORF Transcript_2977/g.7271 Transcript_2977/m.7271 type:complete len:347 (-) Transcript_2977:152-1192(-)